MTKYRLKFFAYKRNYFQHISSKNFQAFDFHNITITTARLYDHDLSHTDSPVGAKRLQTGGVSPEQVGWDVSSVRAKEENISCHKPLLCRHYRAFAEDDAIKPGACAAVCVLSPLQGLQTRVYVTFALVNTQNLASLRNHVLLRPVILLV